VGGMTRQRTTGKNREKGHCWPGRGGGGGGESRRELEQMGGGKQSGGCDGLVKVHPSNGRGGGFCPVLQLGKKESGGGEGLGWGKGGRITNWGSGRSFGEIYGMLLRIPQRVQTGGGGKSAGPKNEKVGAHIRNPKKKKGAGDGGDSIQGSGKKRAGG